jgi:hypothetical protein
LRNRLENLADLVITDDSVIPFFPEGGWCLHQLLSHTLAFTGAAHVRISSFSLSENAIRSFINDSEAGLIKSLTLLFDISIPRRKMDLMLFAHSVFTEIRLTPNHSKVILIEGVRKACIISSQNLTPNPRLEAGVVFTTNYHYQFFSHLFDHYFANAILFTPYE